MTICKTCGYSSWCDCPKADDKNVNANELAGWLEDYASNSYCVEFEQAATMLRQQQAEMDIVIKLLCEEQVSDDLMAYWNPLHSTLKSKLLKAQEK